MSGTADGVALGRADVLAAAVVVGAGPGAAADCPPTAVLHAEAARTPSATTRARATRAPITGGTGRSPLDTRCRPPIGRASRRAATPPVAGLPGRRGRPVPSRVPSPGV